VYNYSDNSTKPLQITQDDKQNNKNEEQQKLPRQELTIFYGLKFPYRRVKVQI